MSSTRRSGDLYPLCPAYDVGRLRVSPLHELHYEVSGNPMGKPVVVLHGGPGGGSEPNQRRFFDPVAYRVVLFDQRGCGRSTPHGCLIDNQTAHLVADIEALRRHLDIDAWQVFGGSWGSTLALAYAQAHPQVVTELILRGVFLLRPCEIAWFYQNGANAVFPEAWAAFIAEIPAEERGDLLSAYHRRLTSDEPNTRLRAARAWTRWEASTSTSTAHELARSIADDDHFCLAFARIEAHYFAHGGFLDAPNQLLDELAVMRTIPGVIVQGRYDMVCPPRSAWELHRRWPRSRLEMIPQAGHSAYEPGIARALVDATDSFR